jgi:hypothetical protein
MSHIPAIFCDIFPLIFNGFQIVSANRRDMDCDMADDEEADIRAAYELLVGHSDTEENRRSLARHLRSQQPVDTLVRRLLAALIDPDEEARPYAGTGPVEQQLVFKNRRRGRTFNHSHALEIADEFFTFWQRDGGTKSKAIVAVAERNNIEPRTVQRALALCELKFKRLEEAIERNRLPAPPLPDVK